MNYADIDYIEVLLHPQQYSESEIQRALEIDCKSRVAWREMLDNADTDINEIKVEKEMELNNSELDALDAARKAFDEWVLENIGKISEEYKNEIE